MQQFDWQITGTPSQNSAHLRDKLLENFPHMRSHDGCDVTLVFEDDIGTALFKACSKDFHQDAIVSLGLQNLYIMRFMVIDLNGSFQFSPHSNDNAVPNTLLALVSMILEGPSFDV